MQGVRTRTPTGKRADDQRIGVRFAFAQAAHAHHRTFGGGGRHGLRAGFLPPDTQRKMGVGIAVPVPDAGVLHLDSEGATVTVSHDWRAKIAGGRDT